MLTESIESASRVLVSILLTAPFATGCSSPVTSPSRPAATAPPAAAKAPEALALTPPMGFNDWNAFGCDVNEKLIKETADFFISSGLADAGYRYVNIDDCWSLRERGTDGKLVPDPVKFPSGIRGVADYVHARGLKLGIYGDAGTKTCAGYPGSLGKEELDARTWAGWGVDYLKYDNCYNQSDGSRADFVRRYTAMREAIDASGRPMVYSICEWGQSKPWEWAPGVGHLWRTTGDISDSWASVRSIIAQNAPLAPYAGPGHWNDPDMLEIGNGGMTSIEYRTHMSLWAMMAAPLIIGTDLRKASAETLGILGNRDIIALDQDPLGKQAFVVSDTAGRMVFAKPLSSGDTAVALYNSTDTLATVGATAKDAGLPQSLAYRLKDLWSGVTKHAGATFAAGVPAHGVVVYRAAAVADARSSAPLVGVGAELPTLIPSVPGGAVLTATARNHGITDANAVALAIEAPSGWVVHALEASGSVPLVPGESVTRRFQVKAPADSGPGTYAIAIKAAYTWGERAEPASAATELGAAVVVPPPQGVSHLSELAPVKASSALGPVERDQANGEAPEGDGNLLTLGGKVYTRGLGTRAPSEIVYYLGGRCSSLSTDVGVDDSLATPSAASFKVFADDKLVAQSGVVRTDDPPRPLSAKLKGATWLKLVTEFADAAHPVAPTNWAKPLLTCGKSSAPQNAELTIFSFEGGTDGVGLSNAGAGGTFKSSAAFHTDGAGGLEITSPADGNWFGRSFPAPLDLRGKTKLAFDVKTGDAGTVGEFAVEVGPDKKWCQGGHWAWVNPKSSKTIKTGLKELHCPAGTTFDPVQIRGVWVFIKASTVVNAPGISHAVALALLASACIEDAGYDDQADAANCSPPTVSCGSACADTSSDPEHCGSCGRACEANEYCSAGECVGECPAGRTACGASCRDLASETAHCGACDSPCADEFACIEGACIGEGAASDRRIRVVEEKFNVCGRPIFMNGANTPWHRWDDFGGDYDATWWSNHYAELHDAGINSSRVWITCSGQVGIDIGAGGEVLGATPEHWEHLDSFFAVAEERRIYVMATLLSFDHFESGAQTRWKAWIASDENIDSYVENYLVPFLERYGENPYLWSIDLINEPDWAYEREGISWERQRAYFARAARAIHENSDVLVTVGMASPKYSAPCAGCEPAITDAQLREALDQPSVYLDFYSPHYYDWVGEVWGNTLHLRPDSTNFPPGKPMTIGEHPARGTSGHTLAEDLEAALANGWQGTMPWTSNGVDRNGGFAEVSAASAAFRDAHPALVFPGCP